MPFHPYLFAYLLLSLTSPLTLSLTPLPQLEGMERPRTKDKEHSYMELEEDENVVEKYTRAMESVANVLHLDRLKQVGGVGGWDRWGGAGGAGQISGASGWGKWVGHAIKGTAK